ncbi:MAG: hypothetical protein MMC33_008168 [Icmadophila ericetorum]|nr:hypothetical protein [Icmadophila ericetorum]
MDLVRTTELDHYSLPHSSRKRARDASPDHQERKIQRPKLNTSVDFPIATMHLDLKETIKYKMSSYKLDNDYMYCELKNGKFLREYDPDSKFKVVSSGATDVYNEVAILKEEIAALKKGQEKIVKAQKNSDRRHAAPNSTLRHMACISNGGTDDFLVRLIPDALPNRKYTTLKMLVRSGLPVRTDDVTFIILFGFSPSKYYRLRQNTALMEYYDVDNILNMHCDLISNFSMKLFFGPFREWLWDVIRDLDDGRTIFGERGFRSLEVEGLLEHLKDSYTMDRIRSRPWYGQTGQ